MTMIITKTIAVFLSICLVVTFCLRAVVFVVGAQWQGDAFVVGVVVLAGYVAAAVFLNSELDKK
jgi:hypothetical protein